MFGGLQWLSAFQSDWARLTTVGIVAVAIVAIACGWRAMQVWMEDGLDKRSHELKKQVFAAEVAARIERRKAERLKLDD